MQKLLLVALLFSSLVASSQKIEGTVKDEEGNILAFASIMVKGTTIGVTSNNLGFFSLSLSPGNYTLDCRYVGYASVEKKVSLGNESIKVDFILPLQKLILKEVVIDSRAEDPAYEIISQAIKMRPFYDEQVDAFTAEAYVKGLVRLKELPASFMGKKIEDSDKNE